MTNAQVVIRENWRNLNIKINSAIKTMKQNEKAGYLVDEEYKQWLNDLIIERDKMGA